MSALVKAFVIEDGDISSPYYGAKGFKLLNEPVAPVLVKENCAHLQNFYKPQATTEETFNALTAWSLLGCSGKLHTDATITVRRFFFLNFKDGFQFNGIV